MNLITLASTQTVYIKLGGYFYDRLENVVLSCSDNTLLPYLCTYNFLTNNILLSSVFPTVTGMPLSSYSIQGENKLVVAISGVSPFDAYYDLIFINQAGYSKMSSKDYLIRGGDIVFPNDNNMPFNTTTTFGESGVASVFNFNNIIVIS